MRKAILLGGLILLTAAGSHAQDTPRAEVSASYSFLRLGVSNGVNQNGGSVSVAGNFNRWLGMVGDVGAYHTSQSGVTLNTYTYMVGPRFSLRDSGRITPFVQVLAGGAHNTAAAGGFSGSANSFAFSAGGGADLALSRHIALRPQFDYIGLHSQGSTLNSLRSSIGIVFRFGGR